MAESDYWLYGADAVRREAERRVRAGEARAEVARLLGVPLSSMAQWAHAGRWRKKDLDRERATELAGAAAMRISSAHALSLGDEVKRAEMEEVLAAAALEDARRVQAAMSRLAAARALLAEAKRSQMTAINAAYGFGPEPEDGSTALPLAAPSGLAEESG